MNSVRLIMLFRVLKGYMLYADYILLRGFWLYAIHDKCYFWVVRVLEGYVKDFLLYTSWAGESEPSMVFRNLLHRPRLKASGAKVESVEFFILILSQGNCIEFVLVSNVLNRRLGEHCGRLWSYFKSISWLHTVIISISFWCKCCVPIWDYGMCKFGAKSIKVTDKMPHTVDKCIMSNK